MKIRYWGIILALFFFTVIADVFAFKLPDTDQIDCYDADGLKITCPTAGSPLAQDGSYKINPPSFIDNGNGTISDINTGLVWEKEEQNGSVTWIDAHSYCSGLTLGNYSDWRMPTKVELNSLISYRYNTQPFIMGPFNHYISNYDLYHWSATTDSQDSSKAWAFNFNFNVWRSANKNGGPKVKCVRGLQLNDSDYIINGNGTVTDKTNDLQWQQNDGGSMAWDTAIFYCENLSIANKTDWRLPNARELKSIIDDSIAYPAMQSAIFTTISQYYWSSTNDMSATWNAWKIDTGRGDLSTSAKSTNYINVRCVRNYMSGTTPSSPNSSAAVAIGSDQIVFSWIDKSNNEAGFKIDRKLGNCTTSGNWAAVGSIGTNKTIFIDMGLLSQTEYSYRVKAYNDAGVSANSTCKSTITGIAGTPDSPDRFIATSVSANQVNLTWVDNSLNESNFKIYRKVGSGSWVLLNSVAKNITEFNDITALGNSSTVSYSYHIKACNSYGCSPASTIATLPFAPVHLTGGLLSATSVSLVWNDMSSNDNGFQIFRKQGACTTSGVWSLFKTVPAETTAIINYGLSSSTTYAYKIRSYRKTEAQPVTFGYSKHTGCFDITTP